MKQNPTTQRYNTRVPYTLCAISLSSTTNAVTGSRRTPMFVNTLTHFLDYEAIPFYRCADGMQSIILGEVAVFCPNTRYVDIHSIFACVDCRRKKLLRKKAKTETQRYMDMVLRQATTRLAEEREAEDNKTLVGTGNVTPVAERETKVKISILAKNHEGAPTRNDMSMVVCGMSMILFPTIMDDNEDSGLNMMNLRSGPPSFLDAIRGFDIPTQRWFRIEKLRFEKLMGPRMINVADSEFNLSYHNQLRKRLGRERRSGVKRDRIIRN
ncbi:hypothetical protein K505DRAFT_333943 [Melanomma pulvis-pyrius CBS 109.77]|uniref:Uncharacterized protein n=1 Tax=Melanomma pulvis-pyrius CBS 109.77 TaxID=1314802 RepID=A0A6A6XNK1_9PLEO|nr:hypothetical protein K505DRAFT_333943 [Melanomma pulvis-pyrius CBS 109.77]